MTVITADVFQRQTEEFLKRAANGEEITITEGGRDIAMLVPPISERERRESAWARWRELGKEVRRSIAEQGLPPITAEEIREWKEEGRR